MQRCHVGSIGNTQSNMGLAIMPICRDQLVVTESPPELILFFPLGFSLHVLSNPEFFIDRILGLRVGHVGRV